MPQVGLGRFRLFTTQLIVNGTATQSQIAAQRKANPKHLPLKKLPEADRFTQLRTAIEIRKPEVSRSVTFPTPRSGARSIASTAMRT